MTARIDTDDIKSRFRVSDIVGRYVSLKKAGKELVGLCPFHGEKTPSFAALDDKKFAYCHGCGWHGDVIKFVMDITGQDFRGAVESITGERLPAATYVPPADLAAHTAGEFTAIMPVPDDAPPLVTDGKATYFQHRMGEVVTRAVSRADEYRDPDGNLLGVVIRREWLDTSTGRVKKITPTLTYCTGPDGFRGWTDVAFPEPRPLQGLDDLAARPDAVVIVTEGEKAAAAARELFPENVVVTWPNGGKAVARAEWAQLTGRKVIIWPDADSHSYRPGPDVPDEIVGQVKPWAEQEGARTAAEIARIIGHISRAVVLGAPDGWPETRGDGWDAADMLDENPADPKIWMRDMLRRAVAPTPEPAPEPAHDEPDPRDMPPPDEMQSAIGPVEDEPFRLLGYDKGRFFYLPAKGGQIVELSAAQHTENNLYQLAPPDFWAARYSNEKGKTDWSLAAGALITANLKKGVFNPSRKRRGRGAWIDAGRNVFHFGDILWVDDELVPISDFNTAFVYEEGESLDVDLSAPIDTRRAHEVLAIAREFRWENPLSAYLLAGFCVISPVCGALKWRPNMWLVGPAGSGKSTVMKMFVSVLLGSTAFVCEGSTTEASIRQHLDSDARPVIFDEAEPKDTAALMRIRGILDLARVSSAGGTITKGSSDGGRGKSYTIRSCFIFSSVNAAIEFHADDTRTTQIALVGGNETDLERKEMLAAQWTELSGLLARTITPEFSAGLIARTVRNLTTLQHNCDVFTSAAATHFGSMRAGDQFGPMLAGAHLLHSTKLIDYDSALAWLRERDFSFAASGATDDGDDRQLINRILQHRERVLMEQGRNEEMTVGELLGIALDKSETHHELAAKYLWRIGLKPSDGGVWVANKHDGLSRILNGTPWATGWARTLAGIPGAYRSAGPEYFSKYDKSRAVFVPNSWLGPDKNWGRVANSPR